MKKAQELCDKQGGSVANVVTSTLRKYADVENDATLSKDQKVLAIQKELEEATPMTMKDWIEALDNQIIAHKRKVLIDKGRISHKQAIEKAEKEFAIYRKREMDLLESDFDKEIKRLKDKNDNNPN